MPIDRAIWNAEFTRNGSVPWACPSCQASRLRVVTSTLFDGQTRESKDGMQTLAAEPEWIDGRFSCLMDCPHCGGEIAVAGKYRVQDDRYLDPVEGESGDYENYYRPLFFTESPRIIMLPDKTPDGVTDELLLAFRLFWSDPWGCANHIRSAVEELLTAQRIPQTNGRTAKTGGRRFLTLAARIDRYRQKRPDLAEALDAIRWLGNAGSHADRITSDDVLDGFAIIEHVLDALYSHRERHANAIARAINRRKAPRSRRRGAPR